MLLTSIHKKCWKLCRCECNESEPSTHCIPKTHCNSLMNPQGFIWEALLQGFLHILCFEADLNCSAVTASSGYRTDCCLTPWQSRPDILTFALTIQQQSTERFNGLFTNYNEISENRTTGQVRGKAEWTYFVSNAVQTLIDVSQDIAHFKDRTERMVYRVVMTALNVRLVQA